MRCIQNSFRGLFATALLLSAIGTASLFGQTTAPDIIVAIDGSGDFTKIQDAINAVPDFSITPTVIFIKRGLYHTEKLIVPAHKTNVVLIGENREETIISYHIYDCREGGFERKCPAADAQKWAGDNIRTSATLTIIGNGFRAENLTIQNTAGPVGQALAITVRADRVVFRNCTFSSYQDTVYLWSNALRAYFENCLIIGRTDYIYGSGTAFFQECEIRSWGKGWITAPSTAQDQPYGFVFNQCRLTYALNSPRPGDDGAPVALGRPWHNFPKVAWLYCDMTEKIHPLGWPDKWNMPYSDSSTDLHLYEYKNTGPGADMSGRAKWAGLRALTDEEAANYTRQKVLAGIDGWDPLARTPAIPLDTTYNVSRVYRQINRDFPYAIPALDSLPPGVIAHRDLVYATLPETPFGPRDLHADLFRPAKPGKYPAVIMIHGGGWRSGTKSMQVPMAQRIAERGFVTVAVEYQLSLEAKYPAAVHNIKAAIRWMRANAEAYSIDPGRIAISGCSAGGQLAALVGFTNGLEHFEGNMGNPGFSSAVQAIINVDGVSSFLAPSSLNKERKPDAADIHWLGGTFAERPETWKTASPAFWANERSAPVLFLNSGFSRFHAGQDELTGMLKEWGIYHEVHHFNVEVHPFWLFHPWMDETVQYMVNFLAKTLK